MVVWWKRGGGSHAGYLCPCQTVTTMVHPQQRVPPVSQTPELDRVSIVFDVRGMICRRAATQLHVLQNRLHNEQSCDREPCAGEGLCDKGATAGGGGAFRQRLNN